MRQTKKSEATLRSDAFHVCEASPWFHFYGVNDVFLQAACGTQNHILSIAANQPSAVHPSRSSIVSGSLFLIVTLMCVTGCAPLPLGDILLRFLRVS